MHLHLFPSCNDMTLTMMLMVIESVISIFVSIYLCNKIPFNLFHCCLRGLLMGQWTIYIHPANFM